MPDGRRRLLLLLSAVVLALGVVGGLVVHAVQQGDRLPPPQPPPGGVRLVGYWPSWTRAKTPASSLPATALTTLVYFTAGVEGGRCVLGDPVNDVGKTAGELRGNFADLRSLRAANPRLKVMIAVFAPWKGAGLDDVVVSAPAREAFVRSCIELFLDGRLPGLAAPVPGLFDGIDLDWEFPGRGSRDGYTALVEEFRHQLDARPGGGLLTAAIPAWRDAGERYDLQRLGELFDWINLMAYDLTSDKDATARFPAALRRPDGTGSDGVAVSASRSVITIDDAVVHFLKARVPSGKLVLGVPLYGVSWAAAVAPGTASTGAAPGSALAAVSLLDLPGVVHDDAAAQAWVVRDGVLTAFDDEASIAAKGRYVLDRGMGGLMVWHLGFDSAEHRMVVASSAALTAATPSS